MGENTLISWADHTLNFWIGCMKVGPGCDHCYAEELDKRFRYGGKKETHWGAGVPRYRTAESNWQQLFKWNARCDRNGVRETVFVNSLSDFFDNEVPDSWRNDALRCIDICPNLDFILVTKRIGNVAPPNKPKMVPASWLDDWPDHVWLVATIVNQEEADRDLGKLFDVPAKTRGISVEPQLGYVDIENTWNVDPTGRPIKCDAEVLDWVICGAESGAQRRPFYMNWARSLRDQCQRNNTAFFFKQIIDEKGHKIELPKLDGRRWGQWPNGEEVDP